jgi:uncharacterized membrane protein
MTNVSLEPWRRVVTALAALGIVLSLALEVLHARAYLQPSSDAFCALGGMLDCTSVALSRYSVFLGVPVPLWGGLGFLAILMAAVRRSRWLLPLTTAGAVASLVLLAVEFLAIGALCLLCEGVHLVSFALAALAWKKRSEPSASFGKRDDLVVIFGPPAALLLALFVFMPRYWAVFGWRGDVPFAHGKTAEGHPWLGAKAPKITIHEFTDYRCVHCKAAAGRTLRRLAKDPESVRVVRRQFPRMRCPKRPNFGCVLIRMAYCAEEQGKFWQADRWLFERGSGAVHIDPAELAKAMNLDVGALERCLERPDVALRAAAEAQEGLEQDFSGTPTYVVNGKVIPETSLDEWIAGAD